ncbi:Hypp8853 [Branchiostoma lanceolatum]|uniref:Hypp8853 protein n=1 Tax=Branchiostoma lanceolatum TaxID=7740 RepID=A0A8J9ZB35_BRALA|nr:Hypp8853 [Branchiostoma lanceolatum]
MWHGCHPAPHLGPSTSQLPPKRTESNADCGGDDLESGSGIGPHMEVKAMPHLPCGSTAVWGPPLPPKPGKAIRQVVLWGGLDKGRWCCSNDLIKVDLTMTTKTTTAKVCILPGEKQDSVPSSRTGHILVAISSTQAILFGGLELSSRHKRFGTCAQSCRDGYFYSLDMPTLCWQKLPLPPQGPYRPQTRWMLNQLLHMFDHLV